MLLMGVLEWMRAYPQLPERMASHFDFYGTANGWQPKEAFFLVLAVVILMTGVMSFLIPVVIAAAPTEFINLARQRPGVFYEFRDSEPSIGSRARGPRGRLAACASAKDDAACAGLSLRSGGCARV